MMRTLAYLAALALLIPSARLLAEDEAPAAKPKVDAEIQQLIDDLSADDFRTRERASKALAGQMGDAARRALEYTAKHSESVEARWRAQQLLRRSEGAGAKTLAEPETPEDVERELSEIERIRDLHRSLTDGLRLGRRGRVGSFLLGKVKVPGLVLIPEGPGRVRLEVAQRDASEAPTVYRGRSLEAILEQNSELRVHPNLKALENKIVEQDPIKQVERLLSGGVMEITQGRGGMRSIYSVNGVTVSEDANGISVTFRERDENGKPIEREYHAKTREELKEKYPEIADRIPASSGFVRITPQIFGGRALRPTRKPAMGVAIRTPEEALTMHLGLEKGQGALVRSVQPGTQAAELGLERNDVIVSVNETPITHVRVLQRIFERAAADQGPLTVELIRRGQPKTLSR